MPNTNNPKLNEWLPKLKEVVKHPDEELYLVGHSLGCITILRYLESVNTKVGGVVMVAGWMNLLKEIFLKEEGVEEIARPWIETPINWDKVKANCNKFVAIFSDNDYYVPLSDSEIFKEKLGAEIIVKKEMGHFTSKEGVFKLPVVLEFFKNLS